MGAIGVYRITLAAAIFHLVMAIATYGITSSKNWRAGIQNGFWALKVTLLLALWLFTYFISDSSMIFFSTYLALPSASLFVLIQILLLIDFAYCTSESLLELWEADEDKRYLGVLVVITFGSFIATITLTVLLYVWFASAATCHLNILFVTMNLGLVVVMSVISIHPDVQESNPQSGLAQAAMVSIYSTYLVASAITSEPSGSFGGVTCNPLREIGQTETITAGLGYIFTFISLAYSTSSAAVSGIGGTSEGAIQLGGDSDGVFDDEEDCVRYSYSFFHFIFMLAAMYLAMLVTFC